MIYMKPVQQHTKSLVFSEVELCKQHLKEITKQAK